ncbi:MAG: DUF6745 domain-containing protein [Catenulispora sp.]
MKIKELTPDQWTQVRKLRDEWLAHGLNTAPADRPRAETAITEMYRLIGKAAPQFLWVDSPATANLAMWLFDGKLKGSSLRSSLDSSLYSSLDSSLYSSLRSSLDSSLDSSLYSSLYSSLASSLDSSLDSSLGSSLDSSLYSSLASSLDSSNLSLNYNYLWGSYESYWIAFYQVPEQLGIVPYSPEDSRRLTLWADIAQSAGWWWPFDNLCIISERPCEIHTEPWDATEGSVRLHCGDGPAMRFRDNWTVHTWHGTTVPAGLIDGDGWTVEQILAARNQEIRRCAIERIGWETFIDRAALKAVAPAEADPGNPDQTITLYDLPEQLFDEPVRVLLCTNGSVERDGTRRRFGLTVPAGLNDPVAAAAWTYGWTTDQYRALEARR